jgi:hypothetical protein
MTTPERPRPGPRPTTPKPTRSTLAKAVGGLPLPPRVAKPPAPRIFKPLSASPAKPSTAKPRPAQSGKPNTDGAGRGTVAGRLGAFNVARPSLSSLRGEPPRKRR